MDVAIQTLPVARGPYRLYAEVVPGTGVPVVLMHGFPDNTHLYDRLVPHLAGRRPVVRFDFLNTYYHWIPSLRRPRAIALYSTPIVRTAARTIVRRWPDLDRRLYAWQVGTFIQDAAVRELLVPQLYEQFLPARPAFWRLNDDLLGTVLTRRRRIPELRRFAPPVRVIFGARDRTLNPRVAKNFASLFPNSELHLLDGAGHFVQVDQPQEVADLIAGD
jgi:pimeloyl-ACP methyl ester carboxylesterase